MKTDITPLLKDKFKKPFRKTHCTQAKSWEAIQRGGIKFSKIEKVYSYLVANQRKCFSRRQLEETLKIRTETITGIINRLRQQKQVGIEKEAKCEITNQSVCFYYAIDPTSGTVKILF